MDSHDARRQVAPEPEYIHIVGYYREPLQSPLALTRTSVNTVKELLGETEVSPKGISLSADALAPVMPTTEWQRLEAEEFSLSRENLNLLGTQLEDDLASVDSNLRHVMLLRERRGAARLRVFDYMWCFTYESESPYACDQYDAQAMLSLRADYFRDEPVATRFSDRSRAAVMVRRVIEAMAAAGDLYYGLVTCTPYREDGGGMCYYNLGGASNVSNLRFQVEHELWNDLGPVRRQKVRGIYWGQYLSRWHVEQLGGMDRFREGFMKVAGSRSGSESFVRELPEGGVFVKLTAEPLNYSIGGLGVPCGDVGAWLYRTFRQANLLP